jgi:6-phosphofructokinase 2
VDVQTTIGAGDSFVAALVWALNRGEAWLQVFRYAMAAGAAALLKPGTALSQAADIQRLASAVQIREL